jgi:hypothetical protein
MMEHIQELEQNTAIAHPPTVQTTEATPPTKGAESPLIAAIENNSGQEEVVVAVPPIIIYDTVVKTPTYWSDRYPATPRDITNDINLEGISPRAPNGIKTISISDDRQRLPLHHALRLQSQTVNSNGTV